MEMICLPLSDTVDSKFLIDLLKECMELQSVGLYPCTVTHDPRLTEGVNR